MMTWQMLLVPQMSPLWAQHFSAHQPDFHLASTCDSA